LPEAAVPLLNNNDPEVPVDATFAVDSENDPDEPLVLLPPTKDTEPPT